VFLRTRCSIPPSRYRFEWKDPIKKSRDTFGTEISQVLLTLAPDCLLIDGFIQDQVVQLNSPESITFLTNYVNGEYDTEFKSLLKLNKGLVSAFLLLVSCGNINLALL
jgi:hypothetical protein